MIHNRMTVLLCLMLVIRESVVQSLCAVRSRLRLTTTTYKPVLLMGKNEINMERELEVFFESASQAGSGTINKLSLLERAKRAQEGETLENTIFELQDELLEKGEANLKILSSCVSCNPYLSVCIP